MRAGPLFGILIALSPAVAFGQSATTPGKVSTPHPTLWNLSIEWGIDGDDDLDGRVGVRFREVGKLWREGPPLLRVPAGSNEGFTWANRHAGSLFGLRPDTEYEIELTLEDPDGGSEQRTTRARTRPVPEMPAGARVLPANPGNVDAVIAGAAPGEVIELSAGTYAGITVGVDGAPGAPLLLRGISIAEVIIEGQLRMDGRHDVWIENLTVRGQVKFNGATGIVIRGCWVEATTATGDGIVSYGAGSTDGTFTDNVVIGTTVWAESSLGVNGDNLGEGIAVTGPGNVIAYNRVEGFRDCVSLLEDGGVVDQFSIDIVGNDIANCADDAIEADFSMGNVRVLRNRMVNSFIALSSQPSLGGPTYFIRNVSFNNVFQAFKPHRGSIGDLWFHNTVVKPGDAMGVYAGRTWSRAVFRNNLFIGGLGGGRYNGFSNGSGRVLQVADADEATCDFDFDGFGSIGTGDFSGRVGATRFASLAELRARTTEANAVEVGLEIFAASFPFPKQPFPGLAIPDLRLAAGTAAVDVGEFLPGINDGFAGAAPDLGAYELGAALPPYGPRTNGPVCGNGVIEGSEGCDDGALVPGDGCDAACQVEEPTDGGFVPDGGAADAGEAGDGGGDPATKGGCACDGAAGSASAGLAGFLVLGVLAVFWRRRRRGASHRCTGP